MLQRVGMGKVEGGKVVLYCGEGRVGGWRKMKMKKRNNLRIPCPLIQSLLRPFYLSLKQLPQSPPLRLGRLILHLTHFFLTPPFASKHLKHSNPAHLGTLILHLLHLSCKEQMSHLAFLLRTVLYLHCAQ